MKPWTSKLACQISPLSQKEELIESGALNIKIGQVIHIRVMFLKSVNNRMRVNATQEHWNVHHNLLWGSKSGWREHNIINDI